MQYLMSSIREDSKVIAFFHHYSEICSNKAQADSGSERVAAEWLLTTHWWHTSAHWWHS